MLLCPRCEHDYLEKLTIIKLKEIIYVCPDCQATWFSEDSIGRFTFVDLDTYLNKFGIAQNRDEFIFHNS
jgi:transposase-like protein